MKLKAKYEDLEKYKIISWTILSNIIESKNIDDKLFAGNVASEASKAVNVDGGVWPSTVTGIDIKTSQGNLIKIW
jgi:hypothetical protein